MGCANFANQKLKHIWCANFAKTWASLLGLEKMPLAAVSKACSRSASSTAALQLLYGNLEPKQIWRLLAYSGWLRNPAPVDGLSHDFFRVSTILLVQDFATIHSTAGNWFLARNIRNGLKVP